MLKKCCIRGYPFYVRSRPGEYIFKLNLDTFEYELDGPPIQIFTADGRITGNDVERVRFQASQVLKTVQSRILNQIYLAWIITTFHLLITTAFISYVLISASNQEEDENPDLTVPIVVYLVLMFLVTFAILIVTFANLPHIRAAGEQVKAMFNQENQIFGAQGIYFYLGGQLGRTNIYYFKIVTRS